MKILKAFRSVTLVVLAALVGALTLAQDQTTSAPALPSSSPNEAEMSKQRMELSKPGENHKLLAMIAGTWNFTGRHFPVDPGPNKKPIEVKGSLVRKSLWDGRYFISESTGGKLKMPWSDGKEVTYKDMTIEGYDNVKKRFVGAAIDNHWDTGIIPLEGSYDSATKTFIYNTEIETSPGIKRKMRRLVKILDNDHYTEEFYAEHNGHEVKVTEMRFTRVNGE